MQSQNLLSLLSKCHDQAFNMGWWSDCPDKTDPAYKWWITTKLCLIHSEIDEAANDEMDDHLPHRTAFEVELADTVIRILDLIGGIRPDHLKTDEAYDFGVGTVLPIVNDFLMELHGYTSAAMEHFRKGREAQAVNELLKVVAAIEHNQVEHVVDVYGAMVDKLAYNARRADHQLVNRQADGGKSF